MTATKKTESMTALGNGIIAAVVSSDFPESVSYDREECIRCLSEDRWCDTYCFETLTEGVLSDPEN